MTGLNNNSGDERVVAYIVPKAAPGPNVSEMRRFLAKKLPDYMIPTTFIALDAVPLTETLKVDRKALPKPKGVTPGDRRVLCATAKFGRGGIGEDLGRGTGTRPGRDS